MKRKRKEMIGRILLGIVVLTVIVIIIIPKSQKINTPPSPTTSSTPQTKIYVRHNISLTQKGFEPKNITVKKGEMIVWTNNSGKLASVNSADHPTHKKFRFLNLGPFKTGMSIQAIMRRTGNFQYVNHLNSAQTGNITVIE